MMGKVCQGFKEWAGIIRGRFNWGAIQLRAQHLGEYRKQRKTACLSKESVGVCPPPFNIPPSSRVTTIEGSRFLFPRPISAWPSQGFNTCPGVFSALDRIRSI